MDPPPQPLLLTSEYQENVRAWIESFWKIASAFGAIIGAVCLSWMALKYATREELQQERDTRTQQVNEIIRTLDKLADQKEINLELRKAISEIRDEVRILQRTTAWGGKNLDNRDLGHP